jgi:hypothetical protein
MAVLLLCPLFSLGIWGQARLEDSPVQFDAQADIRFPASPAVIDVTRPPYHARGDGVTDDTDALQRALSDTMGLRKILFFPSGTYLISRPLTWSKQNSQGKEAWGRNYLQGQNTQKTVIRLKNKTFTDPTKPQTLMWCGGFGSADWFHNYIQNLTFNVGRENPGAVGLQFYSNNMGAVRDVAIVSEDGQGAIGLDLGHRDMNGPLLVRNVLIKGFQVGVQTGGAVNSQTFERISLVGQSRVGFANLGQTISVRGLFSDNEVPAFEAQSFTVLLDAHLVGHGAAKSEPAIQIGKAPFFARNIVTSGYRTALVSEKKKEGEAGPNLPEFIQGTEPDSGGTPVRSLGLPVRETPEVPWDAPGDWAVVDAFGADPTGEKDASDAIQKALDSGATTVFFPGCYSFSKPVKVRGKVRRLLGCGGWLDYNEKSLPDLIVENGEAPTVTIEHFAPIHGIEVSTTRTVVFRSLEARSIIFRRNGDVFFEDTCTNDLWLNPDQRVWARQLNIENEGTHLTNNGATVWVLGYKTERGGTLVYTRAGGSSEVFGNFSYTTTAGKLAPMFRTDQASVFTFFNEVCYSGDPFQTLIQETLGSEDPRTVKRGEGSVAPYRAKIPKK